MVPVLLITNNIAVPYNEGSQAVNDAAVAEPMSCWKLAKRLQGMHWLILLLLLREESCMQEQYGG